MKNSIIKSFETLQKVVKNNHIELSKSGGKLKISANDLLKDFYKKKYKAEFLLKLEDLLKMGYIPTKRQKKFIFFSNANKKVLIPRQEMYIFKEQNIFFMYDLKKCNLI